MSYIVKTDCTDQMITLADGDVTAADDYVDAHLARIGVTTPLETVPYEVKQLAMAVACRHRALDMSGPGGQMGDTDAYLSKFKVFDDMVNKWQALVTAELINGTTLFECSIDLGRG